MRTLTSLTAMFTLALGLAACGDDKGNTDSSPTSDTPGTETAPSSATDPSGTGTTDGDPSVSGTEPTTTPDPSATEPTTTPDPTAATEGTATEPSTDGTATVGTTTTVDPSEGTTVGTTEDTGAVGEPDPNWPPPNPNAMSMDDVCPEGFAPASFSMGGIVCSPKCTGPGKLCADAETGSAAGACVFNPTSSGADCMKAGDKCEAEGEVCEMTGGGGLACLGASDHCVLLCNQGEACPDGMECFDDLICQYPF